MADEEGETEREIQRVKEEEERKVGRVLPCKETRTVCHGRRNALCQVPKGQGQGVTGC